MEEIFIPATGMAMEQAELIEWLKEPGEAVEAGDPIALIETDKATTEVVAASTGVLSSHLHPAGASVAAGQPIAYVLAAGESEPGRATPGAPGRSDGPTPAAPEAASPAAPEAASPAAQHAGASATHPIGTQVGLRAPHAQSPRERRLQREAAAAAAVGPPEPDHDRNDRARELIGRAVTESWTTIPHFAVSRQIDVTALLSKLADLRASFPLVSVTDLLLRAVARTWCLFRADPDPTVGMSVATDRGVINVSIPGAGGGDLVQLAARRRAAADRARRGRLTASDHAAASITLSNLGTHGVDWFTGIVPMQQLALVTLGRARRSVVVEGDTFMIRDMMWATVNLDHRHLDGADGAMLLESIGEQCKEMT